ncbi:hypothetical protein [Moorena sp. SIO4G3]|uniref:hypothetical protein n=1 Tax=Moorena sp. SIO4G3 TaxID=2607821 RepID=UPI00142CE1EB|nr:hypothetical protein [Moorena sp. SIO4G3]NEO78981.1 hypothetical protein [Moorena sp. SIO4G3]
MQKISFTAANLAIHSLGDIPHWRCWFSFLNPTNKSDRTLAFPQPTGQVAIAWSNICYPQPLDKRTHLV